MRNLVTTLKSVVPRIRPDGDAPGDRGGNAKRVARAESGDQSEEPANHQRTARARHAVQPEEYAGQNQRRSQVLLQEMEHQQRSDTDRQRTNVLQPRQSNVPAQCSRCPDVFREFAEKLPAAREVGRERKDEERPDDFDRLNAQQIHLGSASRRDHLRTGAGPLQASRAAPSGRSTSRRSRGRSKSITLRADHTRHPAAIPPTTVTAASVSRSGSRSAIIAMTPMPVSNCTIGNNSGSPVTPSSHRTAWVSQNTARNKATAVEDSPAIFVRRSDNDRGLQRRDVRHREKVDIAAAPAAKTLVQHGEPAIGPNPRCGYRESGQCADMRQPWSGQRAP